MVSNHPDSRFARVQGLSTQSEAGAKSGTSEDGAREATCARESVKRSQCKVRNALQ